MLKLSICAWESRTVWALSLPPHQHTDPFSGRVLLLPHCFKTCPGIILTQVCPPPSSGDEGCTADGTEVSSCA